MFVILLFAVLPQVLPNVPTLKKDLRNKNNYPVNVTELDSTVSKVIP